MLEKLHLKVNGKVAFIFLVLVSVHLIGLVFLEEPIFLAKAFTNQITPYIEIEALVVVYTNSAGGLVDADACMNYYG